MLWIKKVTLENFQSHEYTVLEFDEGLNTIVGPTDSGKTAVFRGIKWAIYNEPQGDFFIREGTDKVSVQIEFNNGIVLKRYRNKRQNGYELRVPGEEKQIFEGFGRTIPEEIRRAINMSKIDFTPSENRSINMAEQLDGPFLLSESSSVKAAAIGKLVEADVIDLALKDTNTDLRNKKSNLQALKDEEENIEKSLKDFEYLDELKNKIEKLQAIKLEIDKKQNKLEKSQRIFDRNQEIRERGKLHSQILESLKNLSEVEKLELDLDRSIFRLNNLDRLGKKYIENQRKTLSIKEINLSLKNLDQSDQAHQALENLIAEKRKLERIFINKKKIEERELILNKELLSLEKLGETEEKLDRLELTYHTMEKLEKLYLSHERLSQRIQKGESYLKNYRDIEKADLSEGLIAEKLENYNKLTKLKNNLASNIEKTSKEERLRDKEQGRLDSLLGNYREILEEYEICPTCYRKIDRENTEEILKHIME